MKSYQIQLIAYSFIGATLTHSNDSKIEATGLTVFAITGSLTLIDMGVYFWKKRQTLSSD